MAVSDPYSSSETIIDFITGKETANRGAEANRQRIERLLVEKLGYQRTAIEVDSPIVLELDDRTYRSSVDLVVRVHGLRYMAIKCAAGSLGSREREILSAARLLENYQIPLAVASDGKTALVWDTPTGGLLGSGLNAIPTADQAHKRFDPRNVTPLDEQKRHRQMLIFRSYDSMNIHR